MTRSCEHRKEKVQEREKRERARILEHASKLGVADVDSWLEAEGHVSGTGAGGAEGRKAGEEGRGRIAVFEDRDNRWSREDGHPNVGISTDGIVIYANYTVSVFNVDTLRVIHHG